jgi:hypothetical protein
MIARRMGRGSGTGRGGRRVRAGARREASAAAAAYRGALIYRCRRTEEKQRNGGGRERERGEWVAGAVGRVKKRGE